jgi:hypothetical protein
MLTPEKTQPSETLSASGAAIASHPTLTMKPEQIEELRATAQMIASTDPAFHAALVQNPQATLGALIDMNSGGRYELQKGIQVAVLEQTPGTAFVVVPSPDKAEGLSSELAKLSLQVASNPEFGAALVQSPRRALEQFFGGSGSMGSALGEAQDIKVFFEQADELLLVASAVGLSSTSGVEDLELLSSGELEKHMSCSTCECSTCKTCSTDTCFTASNCSNWSFDCFLSTGCRPW